MNDEVAETQTTMAAILEAEQPLRQVSEHHAVQPVDPAESDATYRTVMNLRYGGSTDSSASWQMPVRHVCQFVMTIECDTTNTNNRKSGPAYRRD
jgi:hypothetical protein